MTHSRQRSHNRHSTRLRGYDYSQAGGYFVTMCTAGRDSIFGQIVRGKMELSEIGRIVETCWHEIPRHFPGVRCDVFQVMPNHVHGILDLPVRPTRSPVGVESLHFSIGTHVGTRHAASQHESKISQHESGVLNRFGRPLYGSLSTVIRSFKSAVTNKAHKANLRTGPIWQSRFYDRIIRDDIERFFIEQYIELNPLLWYLDPRNPSRHGHCPDDLREILTKDFGLTEQAIEWLAERGFPT